MEQIKTALLVTVMVTLGFSIPDVITGTFDRANVAVPMIAFVASLLTSWKRSIDNG